MKWITSLLFLIAFVLLINPAQAGNMSVSETDIDYGTIKEGPPVVKTVVVTNTGQNTLIITNVTAS
jgi:hypothetical protein